MTPNAVLSHLLGLLRYDRRLQGAVNNERTRLDLAIERALREGGPEVEAFVRSVVVDVERYSQG